ncbi:hypothetical protein COV77_00320, partial [Candidatus Pacearchaeota archaeon CG11_big_fil_rev_8_21_14_0_20_30_13]
IYGLGLDGSTYQKFTQYVDSSNNVLFEAPRPGPQSTEYNYSFAWRGGASGSAMVIKGNTHRVGIGTVDPQAKVEINGGTTNGEILKITESATGSLTLNNSLLFLRASAMNSSGYYIKAYDGNNGAYPFVVRGDGKVGIGTASPISQLSVGGAGIVNTGIYGDGSSIGVYGNGSSIGVYGNGIYGVLGVGTSYDFYAQGTGTDYGTSSSMRWKNNITEINDALEKVMALRGVYYNWNKDRGGQHDIGFIAEEVGNVLPEVVGFETDLSNKSNYYLDKDGTKKLYATGVDYGAVTPLLVEAIKGLNKKTNLSINNLTMQVFDIKGNILNLQKENSNLKDENSKLKNDTELMKQDLCSLGIKRWC